MKKIAKTKLLAALLIFIFIFTLTSCNEAEKTANGKLEIISEVLVYSEEFIESASERFTNLSTLITKANLDINLTDKEKASIKENFTTTLLPIFYRIKIYEDELDALLASAEENINEEEILSPVTLYESALYSLGSHKSGRLLFEISLLKLKDNEDTARERYDRYGEERYLQDAKRCQKISEQLYDMGEKKFISAVSFATFITSSLLSLNKKGDESAFRLNDAELLLVLDKQARFFDEIYITDSEWQTVGALINELIPINASNLHYAALYTLKNEDYFTKAVQIMPGAISLYSSLASALKANADFSLDADGDAKRQAVISALLSCDEDLRNFDSALMQYAKTDSQHLSASVYANADEALVLEFIEKYQPIDCDELISILKDENTQNGDIENAVISYTSSISPYIAFLLFN